MTARRFQLPRPRLLPPLLAGMALLAVVKLHALATGVPTMTFGTMLIGPSRAADPPAAAPAPAAAPMAAPMAAIEPTPEQLAERALLERLRTRRGEIEAREQALAARETVAAAADRRLTQRIEEMAALQARLEAAEKTRGERDDGAWKQMVKLYEGMRPRDAAVIFDDLEMPVLVQIVDRMGERRAAPVLGAMKPERARLLTAELARHRARPPE